MKNLIACIAAVILIIAFCVGRRRFYYKCDKFGEIFGANFDMED